MEELVTFFSTYGIEATLIAIAGIIILGCLKYFKCFAKYDEKTRHYIYLVFSIGVTLIGVFLVQVFAGTFEISTFFAMATSVYTLNQTFYNVFKITPVSKIAGALLTKILELLGADETDFEEIEEDPEHEEIEEMEETVEPEIDPEAELEALKEESEEEPKE